MLFLALSLTLSGCKAKETTPTGNLVKEDNKILQPDSNDSSIICNKPYILVGKECCLDKDDNRICDRDEGVDDKKDQFYVSGAVLKEECSTQNQFSTIFNCESYKVTPKGVELTLLWESAKLSFIKEISIPGTDCSKKWNVKSYQNAEVVEGGIKRGDRFDTKLDCEIKERFLDTKLKIVYDVYGLPRKDTNITYGFAYESENIAYINLKKYVT